VIYVDSGFNIMGVQMMGRDEEKSE